MFTEYTEKDAVELAALVRTGQVSAAELVEAAIAEIERHNPRLNAVIHRMYERARRDAAGELGDGPFAGVPFLVKDLLCAIEGEPLQSGSRMYRGWRPDYTSAMVERYRASGAIIVGKTNTPELGLLPTTEPRALGPTRNPWDIRLSTGGSSGGSAAAVAARMVPMAGGGDGGGSIRIPSSACGLFGLKPTRGRTPVGPNYAELWHGFAQEHVLSRSVRDSATMLDAVCGPLAGDVHYLPRPDYSFAAEAVKEPRRLRIAYSTKPLLPSPTVHPDCIAAVDETVTLLRELGHEVVAAEPEIDGDAFARAFLLVISCHVAAEIRVAERTVGRKATADDFEPRTWLSARMGEGFTGGEYVDAIGRVWGYARQVIEFTNGYDLFLTPTLSQPPQPLGFLEPTGAKAKLEQLMSRLPVGRVVKNTELFAESAREVFAFIPWTPVFNATGQPSMSVPLTWSPANLPIGSMFTGRFGDEVTLLKLATELERARPWAHLRPPLGA